MTITKLLLFDVFFVVDFYVEYRQEGIVIIIIYYMLLEFTFKIDIPSATTPENVSGMNISINKTVLHSFH